MRSGTPVIGLWGHFADANLGDDACPTALLHHLQRRVPAARFELFCRFPEVAQARWGLPAHPVRPLSPDHRGPWEVPPSLLQQHPGATAGGWRARARAVAPLRAVVRAARVIVALAHRLPAELRFFWQSRSRLRGIDLVIVAGSNPLFDFFGGFWEFPFRVWEWTLLARLSGARVAFVSVGAGPVVSTRSGALLARVLRRATYVSYRDEGSRQLMRRYGFDGPDEVYPDLAHSLPFVPRSRARSARLRVGINPMIVHHSVFWPVSDPATHRRYVDSLAALAAALVAAGDDVFFYGTQKDDRVTAGEIQAALWTTTPAVAPPPFLMPASVDELLGLCDSADLLVTTRFHGAVFGVITARPTLAICYQGKTREVLERAGLGAYAIDFAQVTPELLLSTLARLRAERAPVEKALRQYAEQQRARLDAQYERVMALIPGRHLLDPTIARGSPLRRLAETRS